MADMRPEHREALADLLLARLAEAETLLVAEEVALSTLERAIAVGEEVMRAAARVGDRYDRSRVEWLASHPGQEEPPARVGRRLRAAAVWADRQQVAAALIEEERRVTEALAIEMRALLLEAARLRLALEGGEMLAQWRVDPGFPVPGEKRRAEAARLVH